METVSAIFKGGLQVLSSNTLPPNLLPSSPCDLPRALRTGRIHFRRENVAAVVGEDSSPLTLVPSSQEPVWPPLAARFEKTCVSLALISCALVMLPTLLAASCSDASSSAPLVGALAPVSPLVVVEPLTPSRMDRRIQDCSVRLSLLSTVPSDISPESWPSSSLRHLQNKRNPRNTVPTM